MASIAPAFYGRFREGSFAYHKAYIMLLSCSTVRLRFASYFVRQHDKQCQSCVLDALM